MPTHARRTGQHASSPRRREANPRLRHSRASGNPTTIHETSRFPRSEPATRRSKGLPGFPSPVATSAAQHEPFFAPPRLCVSLFRFNSFSPVPPLGGGRRLLLKSLRRCAMVDGAFVRSLFDNSDTSHQLIALSDQPGCSMRTWSSG
jgi:hypothetical protein